MKFTFVGCSFTYGVGLESQEDTYANQVARYFNADIANLGKGGNSNYNIFLTALNEILFGTSDKIFVQWSAFNRVWLYPGPDSELGIMAIVKDDFRYRDIYFSKSELQDFGNKWNLLNHDYKRIFDVIMYCKMLEKVSNGQVVFINGLLPWTEDLLSDNPINDYESDLSSYSKKILDFENRSDSELDLLITKIKTHSQQLNKKLWVNCFNSFMKNRIDVGTDNQHPGIESHKQYAEWIITYLEG